METPRLLRTHPAERLVLDCMEVTGHREDFKEEVAAGLARTPKSIPPKFFYDEEGSLLFERITELEAYYPTRTEAAILAEHGASMLEAAGPELVMVELGSGSSSKTRLLLDLLARRQARVEYVPIDISPSVVTAFGEQLVRDYPSLHIRGLICDYHDALAALEEPRHTPRLFLFLGSSLGNYPPAEATELLRSLREAMAPADRLLLGTDLKKPREVLERAYDDEEGVTAQFNLNLLARINRELGGHFDLRRFRHVAFYNEAEGRIEMHLESLADQRVPIDALERDYAFAVGERLHTENSYKFDRPGLEALAGAAGLRLARQWTDPRAWFAVNLLQPAA